MPPALPCKLVTRANGHVTDGCSKKWVHLILVSPALCSGYSTPEQLLLRLSDRKVHHWRKQQHCSHDPLHFEPCSKCWFTIYNIPYEQRRKIEHLNEISSKAQVPTLIVKSHT